MKRICWLLSLLATLAGTAHAGEVKIGMDALGMFPKQCHVVRFLGPKEAVARYEKRQKERFETLDPEAIEALSRSVSVSVTMAAPSNRLSCMTSGRPEKIVLAVKGGVEPVLVIPLITEELTLKNLSGAELAAFNGRAELPLAAVKQLVGRELGFHLIFTDRKPYEDAWKKDYAERVLK